MRAGKQLILYLMLCGALLARSAWAADPSPEAGTLSPFASAAVDWYRSAWRADMGSWLSRGRGYLAQAYAEPAVLWDRFRPSSIFATTRYSLSYGWMDWRGRSPTRDRFSGIYGVAPPTSDVAASGDEPGQIMTTAEVSMIGMDDPRFLPQYADAYGAVGFDGSPLAALDEDWSLHVYTGHATPFGFGFGDTIVRFTHGGYSMGLFVAYRF